MTYRGRVAMEMAKRIGIFFAGCAAYIGLALAVGYALWWLFGVPLDIAMQIGLTGPVLLFAAGMLLFIVWDLGKDKVNKEDADIMRALRYNSGSRSDD